MENQDCEDLVKKIAGGAKQYRSGRHRKLQSIKKEA